MAEALPRPPSVVTWPAPVLLRPAGPAPAPGPELHRLLDLMWAACRAAGGAGLAAPQVGVPVRVAVVDGPALDPDLPRLELLDPAVTAAGGRQRGREGCLSLPGLELSVVRPRWVTVRAGDRHGRPFTVRVSGLAARALCHEIDHLDGILILHHLHPWRRRLAERRLRRAR